MKINRCLGIHHSINVLRKLFIHFTAISFSLLALHSSVLAQAWQSLKSFPGLGKDDAVAFSVDESAYLVTGNNGGFEESNYLFCYNSSTDLWSRKADFPGTPRQYASSFVLDGEGYVFAGISAAGEALRDVWKYNIIKDEWQQMTDFEGAARWSGASFAVGDLGFFGTGTNGNQFFKDFWQYSPAVDTWVRVADFTGAPRRETAFFTISERAFVGLGFRFNPDLVSFSDFFEYHFLTNTWTKIADYPGGNRFYAEGVGSSVGAIVFGGVEPATDFHASAYFLTNTPVVTWQKIDDFPEGKIRGSATFAIGTNLFAAAGLLEGNVRTNSLHRFSSPASLSPFRIYPNPSQGRLMVQGIPNAPVEIRNMEGKLISNFSISTFGYAYITDLQPGLYFAKEISANHARVFRFLVE